MRKSGPRLNQDEMLLILDHLARETNKDPYKKKKLLSKFATVSKYWQAYFEKITFRHIYLRRSSLYYFETIVARRHGNIRCIEHIWLHVELNSYACVKRTPKRSCSGPEQYDEVSR